MSVERRIHEKISSEVFRFDKEHPGCTLLIAVNELDAAQLEIEFELKTGWAFFSPENMGKRITHFMGYPLLRGADVQRGEVVLLWFPAKFLSTSLAREVNP